MYCKPSFTFHETGAKVNIMVGPKNCGDKPVEDVLITIPFPKCVATTNLEPTIGTITYDDRTKVTRQKLSNKNKIFLNININYVEFFFVDM
jgi:hypothetical protein